MEKLKFGQDLRKENEIDSWSYGGQIIFPLAFSKL